MTGIRRVYWDTTVFVCFLNPKEGARRGIAHDNLEHARLGRIEIYTSMITISEVIKPKDVPRTDVTPEQVAKIKRMFDWDFLRLCIVDRSVANLASELRLKYPMRTPDAIHAATAISLHANPNVRLDALQNWDRDYNHVADQIAVEQPEYLSNPRPLYLPPTNIP